MCCPTTKETTMPANQGATAAQQEQQLSQRLKRSQNRVSFQAEEARSIIEVECFAFLRKQEREDVWYTSNDIESFRDIARKTTKKLRKSLGVLSYGDHGRGLEFRTDRERQERKYWTNKVVVKAQHKYDANYLAKLYKRCSAWTKTAAMMAGSIDFYAAYDIPLPSSGFDMPSMTDYPLPFRSSSSAARKRSVACTTPVLEEVTRNVRRRVPFAVVAA